MSHHDRLEQVLGRLRKMNLTDDEVDAAMMPLNNAVQGYAPVDSIRVARPENATEVATYLAHRSKDFGPTCTAADDVVAVGTERVKLLLVGYHYDHNPTLD